MSETRKITWRHWLFGVLSVFCVSDAAFADYPDRAITIVVPYSPGAGTDLLARATATRLSKVFGQPVIVVNQPGAGGSIGTARVAKSQPDGYTLLLTVNTTLTIQPVLYTALSYESADLVPIVRIGGAPMVMLTPPKLPVTNIPELIAWGKKQPEGLLAGISGIGAATHLGVTEFSRNAGVKVTIVPYRGGPAVTLALMTGEEIQFGFSDIVPALPLIRDNRIRVLGTAQAQRTPIAPDIPALSEVGMPGLDIAPWMAMFVPRGTPDDITQRLNLELTRIVHDPEFKKQTMTLGMEPMEDPRTNTPQALRDFLAAEIKKWGDMVRRLGLAPKATPEP